MAEWRDLNKKQRKDTLDGWQALYGDKVIKRGKPKVEVKKPVAGLLVPTEDEEQTRFVQWLRFKKIRHHHSPNGGRRVNFEGQKFQRLGTSPGYPDIHIPIASCGYHALFIEMKRTKGGVISPMQKEWIQWLNLNGSKAVVCKGADEAIKAVEEYLGL